MDYTFLDDMKTSKFQKRLSILAAIGPFTDGFNEFGASTALLAIGVLFHLSVIMSSVILASYWIGVGAGGMIGGVFSDKIGRKTLFVYDTIGMGVFALISAVSFNGIFFFFSRLLLGFFIGIDYVAALPLISEYAPIKDRGKLLSTQKFFFTLGALLAIGEGLGLTILVGVDIAWRYIFITAAIPVFILFFLRKSMPESIRWAVENGKENRVKRIKSRLKKFGIDVNVKKSDMGTEPSIKDNLKKFFSRPNLRALVYIFWLGTAYSMTINLVSVYEPKFLDDLGATSTISLLGSVISAFLGLIGTVIVILTIDKIGRKNIGVIGFMLSAIPMGVMYAAFTLHAATLPLIMSMFALFYFINVGTIGTLQYVPAAELGGTRNRGLSMGWDKLWEFPTAAGAFALYAYLGPINSVLFDTIMPVVGGIILYILAIETNDKSLEYIEDETINEIDQPKQVPEED
ncbi:MFS transporter [Ferroplasma sp.]|uniref:MFS transporter n=1 Tax=Ferroplasma sp. TaxID=2591003 RepID=UPI00260A5C23|nr:MFS transporter [Ferroplasma sp.]